VRARLETREQGISYTEFSYMLLQAYDFLHLFDAHACNLQTGGSDQWGNITAGVELVRRTRGREVHGLTWPLLTKADGSKFGKSEEGNVWLDPARTSPYQFFQFWIRQDDRDVGRLLRLFTDVDRHRIAELEASVAEHPERREAQTVLATEMTALVHGPEEAAAAMRASQALFGGDLSGLDEATLLDVFAEAPSTSVARSDLPVPVVDLLVRAGVVPSRSAARRELDQGGIYVNNVRVQDEARALSPEDLLAGGYLVVRRGKRNYHLVRFGS
jgi:tyrosyl-tRNA synthetase